MAPRKSAAGHDMKPPTRVAVVATWARRALIGLSGGLVLIIGLAMTVLPGPAIVFVPLGLAILATEFAWARRMAHRLRKLADRASNRMRKCGTEEAEQPSYHRQDGRERQAGRATVGK
jgi:Flp pilus assembly protein TadB